MTREEENVEEEEEGEGEGLRKHNCLSGQEGGREGEKGRGREGGGGRGMVEKYIYMYVGEGERDRRREGEITIIVMSSPCDCFCYHAVLSACHSSLSTHCMLVYMYNTYVRTSKTPFISVPYLMHSSIYIHKLRKVYFRCS